VPHPCEVCRNPDRVDTVELALVQGGYVWACGSCGYQLDSDGDLLQWDEEDL